ncbi:uncharacterized protein [Littorina saxatilis]|uniref:uncharacterized protein n=1 Tax=Littorina saxatilis TaxID=31220 RepID=UPI0038B558B5
MPLEQDVKTFRDYVVQRTKSIMEDPYKLWDMHAFIELRNLIVARLTLFNARRGGEPARLLLSEWEDALKGVWIDPDLIEKVDDQIEKALVDQYKLAYQVGKGGRKLVPVLIPFDTIDPLKMLVSFFLSLFDIPAGQREVFYRHMGHSGKINEDVYQSPLAVMEITQVTQKRILSQGKEIPEKDINEEPFKKASKPTQELPPGD